jgi:magnesium-transporting ATPase (P-type)
MNIVYLIVHGRMVYQRLLTWVINKISRAIQKAPYVAIAYVITGKFVVSAFAMLLLVLVTDLTKIALATDMVRPSIQPESWKINGYIRLAVVLGLAMLAESLLLLWFGWNYFDLNRSDEALNTFSFLCLLYMGAFSILSVRERLYFWSSRPGTILLLSFFFEVVFGTMLASHGLGGMSALPWGQTLGIFIYSMISCLIVNDLIKHWMIKKLRLITSKINL